MQTYFKTRLAEALGQCRTTTLEIKGRKYLLAVYSKTINLDPYTEIFVFPEDPLKMSLLTLEGEILWTRVMSSTTLNGIWFNPVLPFDLDQDGIDEIWSLENDDPVLPFSNKSQFMKKINPETGEVLESYPWTSEITNHVRPSGLSLTFMFRNFIMGGYVHGEPVLITGKGTYSYMFIEAHNADMSRRWKYDIMDTDPGARGSHITPILDINNDGVEELFWGERCIELDTGCELFCYDKESYSGHSDIVQPIFDYENDKIYIFIARETEIGKGPRVNVYNTSGSRVWGKFEQGHMHVNWACRIKEHPHPLVMSAESGGENKYCLCDAFTGDDVSLPFDYTKCFPVDINGDGYHEFLHIEEGTLFNAKGDILGQVEGHGCQRSRILDSKGGEQIITFSDDGYLSLWYNPEAVDSKIAQKRYEHPFYKRARAFNTMGYNWNIQAGV